jgi:hypothetical protein
MLGTWKQYGMVLLISSLSAGLGRNNSTSNHAKAVRAWSVVTNITITNLEKGDIGHGITLPSHL